MFMKSISISPTNRRCSGKTVTLKNLGKFKKSLKKFIGKRRRCFLVNLTIGICSSTDALENCRDIFNSSCSEKQL